MLANGDAAEAGAPAPECADAPATCSSRALTAAVSACAGELITTGLFFPIELVKCRLQAQLSDDCDDGSFHYSGLTHGIQCILRDEGIQGLFTGLPSASLRSLSSELATMYFGELLLARYRLRVGSVSSGMMILLRTLGGWVSVALTLPFEAVATRVNTSRPPLAVGNAARLLWREGGYRNFWRGFPVSLILCLNPALMLTAVDTLRALLFALLRLRRKALSTRCEEEEAEPQQMSMGQAFVIGAVAKLLTMCAVYPLVRGKVLLQARDRGGAGIFQVLAVAAAKEGLPALYRGLGAQLSKSMLSASVKYAVKERAEGCLTARAGSRSCGGGPRGRSRGRSEEDAVPTAADADGA